MLLPNSKDRNKVCPETTKIEITNKLSYSMLNKLEPVTVVAWVNINTSTQDVTGGLHSAPLLHYYRCRNYFHKYFFGYARNDDNTSTGRFTSISMRCLCRKAD